MIRTPPFPSTLFSLLSSIRGLKGWKRKGTHKVAKRTAPRSPKTVVTDSCESPYQCWELNPSPQQEQQPQHISITKY